MRAESVHWAARGAGLAIGAGVVLVVAYVALTALPVLLLVFLAVLLGAALEPLVAWIRVKTGMRRGFGILVVYAGFLAIDRPGGAGVAGAGLAGHDRTRRERSQRARRVSRAGRSAPGA